MSVNANKQAPKVTPDKSKAPKLRFTLGNSERYYEPAQYLSAITVAKVVALFANEAMSLEETEGKSLKVMYKTDTEVKFWMNQTSRVSLNLHGTKRSRKRSLLMS